MYRNRKPKISFVELNKLFLDMCKPYQPGLITGKSRSKPLAERRGFIAKNLRAMGYSCADIGFVMNRDHSTIIYMLKKYADS